MLKHVLTRSRVAAGSALILAGLLFLPAGCPVEDSLAPDELGPADQSKELALATMAGWPVRIDLPAGSARSIELGAAPEGAELVEETGEDGGRAVVFTPALDFSGEANFEFIVDEAFTRTLHQVHVTVYPAVRFRAEPLEDGRPLKVAAEAYTLDGSPLPEGTYEWRFDEQPDVGPKDSHHAREHVFAGGGRHMISLSLALAGMAQPAVCASAEGLAHLELIASPIIQGQVLDAAGNPVAGLEIQVEGRPSVRTNEDGGFTAQVPPGWSGRVTPMAGPNMSNEPAEHTYQTVLSDVEGANFRVRKNAGEAPIDGKQTVIVSGTVWNQGEGLPGALLRFTGSGSWAGHDKSVESGADGSYAQELPHGWRGVVHPESAIELTPVSVEVVALSDQVIDFTAGRTLYVATDGDDSNPGTADAPLRTLQRAAGLVQAGETVVVRAGVYDSGSNSQDAMVLNVTRGGQASAPVTFRAESGARVVLDGREGRTRTLVTIAAPHVRFEGFELTGAARLAVEVAAPAHHVTLRRCHAHHNMYDQRFIGAAFRVYGPVHDVLFEECISNNNNGGFQTRESPTQTAATALVPPKAGNEGYSADLPESQWDSWPGWTKIAARRVTFRRCMAFDNQAQDEHSDGFGLRYGIECVFEDCIAWGNGDDNFDLLGATRCVMRDCIAFDANPANTDDGDGNGIKIGVRGGLDNVIYRCLSFNNPRAGIDMADTERACVYNNTCYNNGWLNVWFEAGRANSGGVTSYNNLCAAAGNADIGKNGSTRVTASDYNCMGDGNDHNWALPLGPHDQVNAEPRFELPALVVSTKLPANASIAEKVAFIRSQVRAKFMPQPGSPAVDAGRQVPGVTDEFTGSAPDIGALER